MGYYLAIKSNDYCDTCNVDGSQIITVSERSLTPASPLPIHVVFHLYKIIENGNDSIVRAVVVWGWGDIGHGGRDYEGA